ncbi:hypothetical protein BU16DRAFT_391317 [Lophium mytilinum]|uniref:Uncharacterized protein n=1 Tax=Lophium mytilinum TaxID=390894 RepID=A0A6A6QTJ6_9PEZI|nr:hypothetical protein BU16DRAFT_391317 [Lophium mytilinum]
MAAQGSVSWAFHLSSNSPKRLTETTRKGVLTMSLRKLECFPQSLNLSFLLMKVNVLPLKAAVLLPYQHPQRLSLHLRSRQLRLFTGQAHAERPDLGIRILRKSYRRSYRRSLHGSLHRNLLSTPLRLTERCQTRPSRCRNLRKASSERLARRLGLINFRYQRALDPSTLGDILLRLPEKLSSGVGFVLRLERAHELGVHEGWIHRVVVLGLES